MTKQNKRQTKRMTYDTQEKAKQKQDKTKQTEQDKQK